MARVVDIIPTSDLVRCEAGGSCVLDFTVTNITNRRIRVGAKAVAEGATKEEWLKLEGGPEWGLDRNATDKVTVRVRIPIDTAAGKYNLHLCVYATNDPDEDYTDGSPVAVEVTAGQPVQKESKPVGIPWWIPGTIVGVLLVIGMLIAVLWPEGKVEVPNVVGRMRDEARAALVAVDLDIRERPQPGAGQPIGQVVSQDPPANTKVAPKTAVTLVIAEAEAAVTIPNVVSLLFDQAKAELESKGLRAMKKEPPRAVRDFQGGQVISQSPAALRSVPLGTMVELEIAADLPYGPDTCIQGYVWREAYPGDHVCATPETRTQAAVDNSQAEARRQTGGGPYGPDTCVQGYVWREARPEDHVCVTGDIRAQAAFDNSQAAVRRVLQ